MRDLSMFEICCSAERRACAKQNLSNERLSTAVFKRLGLSLSLSLPLTCCVMRSGAGHSSYVMFVCSFAII